MKRPLSSKTKKGLKRACSVFKWLAKIKFIFVTVSPIICLFNFSTICFWNIFAGLELFPEGDPKEFKVLIIGAFC